MTLTTQRLILGVARPLVFVLLLCLTTLPVQADSTAERLADLPVPIGTRIQSVGDDTIHNGRRMSLAAYDSALTLAQTIEFYRNLWSGSQRDGAPNLVEARAGQWLMLSQLHEGYNTVVQLKQTEPYRSTGYASVMEITPSAADFQGSLAMPGFTQLSSTLSFDGPRKSALSVYTNSDSVMNTARQLASHWQAQDWTLVSERVHQHSKVLLLNRLSAQLEIVVSGASGGGSIVVINQVSDRG